MFWSFLALNFFDPANNSSYLFFSSQKMSERFAL
jgi:hypothetical protein